jgi:hypothetical protein
MPTECKDCIEMLCTIDPSLCPIAMENIDEEVNDVRLS